MAAEYLKIIRFESIDKDTLFNHCAEAAIQCGYKIVERNSEKGKLLLKVPINWYSWGETISVELSNLISLTEVEIRSWCKGIQIIDWGKNRRNVNQLVKEIKSKVN